MEADKSMTAKTNNQGSRRSKPGRKQARSKEALSNNSTHSNNSKNSTPANPALPSAAGVASQGAQQPPGSTVLCKASPNQWWSAGGPSICTFPSPCRASLPSHTTCKLRLERTWDNLGSKQSRPAGKQPKQQKARTASQPASKEGQGEENKPAKKHSDQARNDASEDFAT